jgi:Leucine rich repeat variant
MKHARDVRSKRAAEAPFRGSQVIFGERRHLEEVVQSVRRGRCRSKQKQQEIRLLGKLIRARTAELNSINPAWDRKFARAKNPKTGARDLLRQAAQLPRDDYMLARTLAEHPSAPPRLLEALADHPYSAVRENVARHPHTPASLLERLAADSHEPLWFLVACNPSTPPGLRERLRKRLGSLARD